MNQERELYRPALSSRNIIQATINFLVAKLRKKKQMKLILITFLAQLFQHMYDFFMSYIKKITKKCFTFFFSTLSILNLSVLDVLIRHLSSNSPH